MPGPRDARRSLRTGANGDQTLGLDVRNGHDPRHGQRGRRQRALSDPPEGAEVHTDDTTSSSFPSARLNDATLEAGDRTDTRASVDDPARTRQRPVTTRAHSPAIQIALPYRGQETARRHGNTAAAITAAGKADPKSADDRARGARVDDSRKTRGAPGMLLPQCTDGRCLEGASARGVERDEPAELCGDLHDERPRSARACHLTTGRFAAQENSARATH